MRTLDLQEAAELLRLHPVTLRDKARLGEIPGAKIGKCWIFVDVDLIEHIRSQYPLRVMQGDRQEQSICHPISVPLNRDAIEVLLKQVGKHPQRVFTYKGKPITNANTRAWREALTRAEIEDFRWHDLRHTWATWHRRAGTPTHELQRLGGWRTASMVERYAHLASDHLAESAARLGSVVAGYDLATVAEK